MKMSELLLWLGEHQNPIILEEVVQLVNQEKKERLLKDNSDDTDYGYSFPGVDRLNLSCLSEVRSHYESTGKKPKVLDIGAGFGNMTWKLLAAGAQVDAIELQSATAEELQRRIGGMNPNLWRNESLTDLLQVHRGDALHILNQEHYHEQFDYVWCSQVIHFMTPEQVACLKERLQQVLKPGGKVFMMANYVYQFNFCDQDRLVQQAYEAALSYGAFCPGYMALNIATLIDPLMQTIVDYKLLSAYNLEQMRANDMPLDVNGYVKGKLIGPIKDYDFERVFSDGMLRLTIPGLAEVNMFYQTMNLFEPKAAKITFQQPGFAVSSFKLDAETDRRPLAKKKTSCIATVVLMEKAAHQSEVTIEPGAGIVHRYEGADLAHLKRFFQPNPEEKLAFLIKKLNHAKQQQSLNDALKAQNYSLLLRMACALGNLPVVKVLLKNQEYLNVDVNATSSNGKAALDWVHHCKAENSVKEALVSLLETHGASKAATSEALEINLT